MKLNSHITRISSSLLAFLLIVAISFGQERREVIKTDTTEISVGKRQFLIIKDENGKRIEIKDTGSDEADDRDDDWTEDRDWEEDDYDYRQKQEEKRDRKSDVDLLGLDIGFTNYFANGVYGTEAAIPELDLVPFRPGGHVALHLLPTRVSMIGNGAVNLKTAITVDWNNYHLTNDVTILEGQEQLTFDSTGVSFSKNKLMVRYAQIPLMLNINTDPQNDDGVSISFGVYGGVLWRARTKQVSEEMGKVKINGEYNLNPFRYGLMARIDFKWFDFYMNYNLSELFAEGNNPSTQTFVAGINLIDF